VVGVIKSEDLRSGQVRSAEFYPAVRGRDPVVVGLHADPAYVALESELEARSSEIAELHERLERLSAQVGDSERQVASLLLEHEDALIDAEAKGRSAGWVDGADAKAETLQRLEATSLQAIELFRNDLRGMEALAVALSKAALAKVFGDTGDTGDMAARVTSLVHQQISGLDRAAVLQIEVSAVDFSDEAALDELRLSPGLSGIEVIALEGRSAGDCRIRLKLGELDVGLGQQWSRLSKLFDETLAMEESR
jgi:flagellar assembly protein FliH